MRLRIDLSYDGTDFSGWAAQPRLRTVQGELQAALTTVLRTASPVVVTCAGRTDAGVHARGQVTHVDLPPDALEHGEEPATLTRRLNGLLPPDIRIRRIAPAPEGFDARFAALWRRYAYRIVDRPEHYDPLLRRHVLHWPRPLDVAAMDEAGRTLTGLHDFASFCKRREGATTIRTLLDYEWSRGDDGVLVGHVRADAFCHSMVRALVGCTVAIGEGRRPVGWAVELLAGRQRDPGAMVMKAHGLTLEEVAYPADDQLAARVELTSARRTHDMLDGAVGQGAEG